MIEHQVKTEIEDICNLINKLDDSQKISKYFETKFANFINIHGIKYYIHYSLTKNKVLKIENKSIISSDLSNMNYKQKIIKMGYDKTIEIKVKGKIEEIIGFKDEEFGNESQLLLNLLVNLRFKYLIFLKSELNDILYKAVVDLSENSIALHKDGIIEYVNQNAIKIFEAKNEYELIGTSVIDRVHEDDRPMVLERINKMKNHKSVERWKVERFYTLKNNIINVKTSANFIIIDDETYIMVVVKDVTDELKLKEQAELSELKSQRLIEDSPDAILITQKEKIVYANSKVDRLLGQRAISILGKNILIFSPDKSIDNIDSWLGTTSKEQRYNRIIPIQAKNLKGEMRYLEISMTRTNFQGIDSDLIFIRDRTEFVKVANSLYETEYRYKQIFENSIDGVYATKNNNFIKTNPALRKMLNYTAEELSKLHVNRIYKNPEDRDEFISIMNSIGYVSNYELELIDKNGKVLTILLSAHSIKDRFGKIKEYQGIIKNITDTKRLEKAILISQKLESLGLLAGGIAHDFNNLLMGILSSASLAKKINENQELEQLLNMINTTSMRASKLVNQLLAYAGEVRLIEAEINTSDVIQGMINLLEMNRGLVKFKFEFFDLNSIILGDRIQIEQVILNLILNSIDAINETKNEGLIKVTTEIKLVENNHIINLINMNPLKDGLYSVITIEDNGIGIRNKDLNVLFDPFFTTKFTGRGLGLAAVQGIMKSHNAGINVSTELNIGTTFELYFPIKRVLHEISKEDSKTYDSTIKEVEQKKNKDVTVLIIDDEDVVLTIVKKMIKRLGFNAISANNGKNGIKIFKENINIDMVVLDLTMKDLNGIEVYDVLNEINPSIPVIISSGYSKKDVLLKFKHRNIADVLSKPYVIEDLRSILTKFV